MDIAEDIGTVVPGLEMSASANMWDYITYYKAHDCGGDVEDAAQKLVLHQPEERKREFTEERSEKSTGL